MCCSTRTPGPIDPAKVPAVIEMAAKLDGDPVETTTERLYTDEQAQKRTLSAPVGRWQRIDEVVQSGVRVVQPARIWITALTACSRRRSMSPSTGARS